MQQADKQKARCILPTRCWHCISVNHISISTWYRTVSRTMEPAILAWRLNVFVCVYMYAWVCVRLRVCICVCTAVYGCARAFVFEILCLASLCVYNLSSTLTYMAFRWVHHPLIWTGLGLQKTGRAPAEYSETSVHTHTHKHRYRQAESTTNTHIHTHLIPCLL